MYNEAMHIDSYLLLYVLDQYKTQQMCNELMCTRPAFLDLVSDCVETEKMRIKGVDVPDHFKSQKKCNPEVSKDPYSLQYVSDWLVMQEQVKIWHDNNNYWNDAEIVEWYIEYKTHH